jgi:hypothetical protein
MMTVFETLTRAVINNDIRIFAETSGGGSYLRQNAQGAFEINFNKLGPAIFITSKSRTGLIPQMAKNNSQLVSDFTSTVIGGLSVDDSSSAIYTLAHEYGHFLSWQNETRTSDYESALNDFNDGKIVSLSIEQKKLILNEEELAWKNAKLVLDQIYNVDKLSFASRQEHDLQIYRELLITS